MFSQSALEVCGADHNRTICYNNGSCVNGTCMCPAGYTGLSCSNYVCECFFLECKDIHVDYVLCLCVFLQVIHHV